MSYVTFMSRIAAGVCGALILGTAATRKRRRLLRRRQPNHLWEYR
jgi:hypothetical protein